MNLDVKNIHARIALLFLYKDRAEHPNYSLEIQ